MKRFVSVWLPDWPLDRLRRREPSAVPAGRPTALVAAGRGGLVLTAVDRAAAAHGLRRGQTLADARAILPTLRSRAAEPEADARALAALAAWCGRYGIERNVEGSDGVWIDATGVAHLFGGEAALLRDLVGRLQGFGLSVRAAFADTSGAAHGLARYGTSADRCWVIAPQGLTREALAPLPVEALRLTEDSARLLRRLGLKRIGALYDLPRDSLARRFSASRSAAHGRRRAGRQGVSGAGGNGPGGGGDDLAAAVLGRLDEALGRRADPRRPQGAPPFLAVARSWPDPLISHECLLGEVGDMCLDLGQRLERLALGARWLRLVLYRADGTRCEVRAGTSLASRDGRHLLALLAGRLADADVGHGIDGAVVEAVEVEAMGGGQERFVASGLPAEGSGEALARLIDRLAGRLGSAGVCRFVEVESHCPELASRLVPALKAGAGSSASRSGGPGRVALQAGVSGTGTSRALGSPNAGQPRRAAIMPLLLLARAEPVEVVGADRCADVAPARFIWRRRTYDVVRAEGPARIAPEWWRAIGYGEAGEAARHDLSTSARDYVRIEVEGGGRYWMFRLVGSRSGEAGAALPPSSLALPKPAEGGECWFVHGLVP
ncbi:MAG: DNA polymerase Y family protein [Hyphomicrobiaceae bacterium]|nr:DNA polymerase Y family protein [Hyphomicrobiaceae bacterium]